MIQLSALCVGAPLVLFGVAMTVSDAVQDVVEISRLHELSAGPHVGLALGPIFILVGASFFWPLRAVTGANLGSR